MAPVAFLVALFLSVPVAVVLALTAIWYVLESGNAVLFDSVGQKLFGGWRTTGCSRYRC